MTVRKTGALRRNMGAALLAGTALLGGFVPAFAPQAFAAPSEVMEKGGVADLVERVSPAVVTITAAKNAPDRPVMRDMPPGFEEFLRRFGVPGLPDGQGGGNGGGGRAPQARALGSGFVFDASGYVATNRHVIADADEVTVTFQDGTERAAEIVGEDERTDLAVLKVKADKPLAALKFADSDKVRVGDVAIAVGNPFGLGGTVTAGIVSARSRAIGSGPYDDYLQLDASINRGNSGGPTFNMAGDVIGINTAIFSPNGGSVGIGFAIPSNMAKPVLETLKQNGKIDRGWLGVSLQPMTKELADSLGLPKPEGALIAGVEAKSPAEKGGLKAGDVVLSADGKPMKDTRDLARHVGMVNPGAKVDLSVWRDGKARDLKITVAQAPTSPDQRIARGGAAKEEGTEVAGLKLSSLNDQWRERLQLDEDVSGVVVLDVPGDVEGLRAGDVIQSVNNTPVAKPADVSAQVSAAAKAGRKNALIQVRRGDASAFLTIPVKPI
ncbi:MULTISPECIES: DegQ family serine endoprotease [unclassified Azospirillum]|uniref:DegQ family serine endoprotease n=1 Tax=unclassified Azospirillum TaxID=2630922 RepID=UPI000B6BD1E7|nr:MULTISPECIES: DegQ family serine endoprotease [unclassified Azospirillum]SNT05533.1 serine protease Do [Azospirillum sp. RU38E]SNT20799.1 serine protease Do [Azospirillum sp. RU37A]